MERLHPLPGDRSPRGLYTARPEGRRVIRESEQQDQLEFHHPVERVTVADDGTTAVLLAGEGGRSHLVVDRNGDRAELDLDLSLKALDLDSSGEQLAYSRHNKVFVRDQHGERELTRTPRYIERLEYLEDDRLLIQSHASGWGVAHIPTYYLCQPDGSTSQIEDVDQAEALGEAVWQPLCHTYQRLFPGLDEATARDFAERFGYALPNTRLLSPEQDRVVFNSGNEVFSGSLPDGKLKRVGEGKLQSVFWGGEQVAVAFETRLEIPGRAVLPYRVHQASWKNGVLMAQAHDGTEDTVFAWKGDRFFPVSRGRFQKWIGDKMLIEREGREALCEPVPLEPDQALDYLIGPVDLATTLTLDEEMLEVDGHHVLIQD